MDTPKRLHENISALADGELPDSELELALAALDSIEGRAAWHAYHLIGDALRAGDDGTPLDDGFATRLAARLAQEPAPPGMARKPDAPRNLGKNAPAPAAEPNGAVPLAAASMP